ncbi:hypothetical protein IMSAGC011_01999 [Lachnospiraceae bacterium]|nr:hypothetical protein IMSAGC011_01999 [Lachnospiraceae bacterium]
MLNQRMNLATLCLRLCEEIEEYYAGSNCQLKPMLKDEAFEKEVAIGEDIYHALYEIMCELIDIFRKENDKIIVSTYQTGIVIAGLEIAGKNLYDLCLVENDKYLIQRSRLGIALVFLQQEKIKVEQVYGKGGGIELL